MTTKNILLIFGGILTLTVIIALLTKTPESVSTDNTKSYVDSLETARIVDSLTDAYMDNFEYDYERKKDSLSKIQSPIQITDFILYNEEYSNYQSLRLKYKNVSDKTVIAAKFHWYDTKDVFGDPVDLLSYTNGWTESTIKPNQTSSSSWDLLEQGIKSGKAYCYEVVYSDGTKWELKLQTSYSYFDSL